MANLACSAHGKRVHVFRSAESGQPTAQHRIGDGECGTQTLTIAGRTLTLTQVITHSESKA